MITRDELAYGVRFAGKRAAAAATYCVDWDYPLAHGWTSGDAFRHVAAGAVDGASTSAAGQFVESLRSGRLSGVTTEQVGAVNERAKAKLEDWSRDRIIAALEELGTVRSEYLQTIDEELLSSVIRLGGYEMPLGEILAQIWVQHTIAHAYEASARWP